MHGFCVEKQKKGGFQHQKQNNKTDEENSLVYWFLHIFSYSLAYIYYVFKICYLL